MARSKPQHIDEVLRDWPYQPGEVSARIVRAGPGREVLQLRIDLGVLQMETTGRPDGARPEGYETYYDFLLARAMHEGDGFQLTEEECNEADREFVQYYQRRLCWLALGRYAEAQRDADHSLAFLDFVQNCSPSDEWTWSHERYRPFILFHRTQAAALGALDRREPDAAIEHVNAGLNRIEAFFSEHEAEEQFDEDELVVRLKDLREAIRDKFHVGRTLHEQLADAIATEQYELAAELRDAIQRKRKRY
jgi:hypothetical protein